MLKYILPMFLLAFTACDVSEEDILKSIVGEADPVPLGTYVSDCIPDLDAGTSSVETLELVEGSYTIAVSDYPSSTNCTGSQTINPPGPVLVADFSGVDLGSNVSYFTDLSGNFFPYFSSEGVFAIGDSITDIGANVQETFQDFADDYENNVRAVYRLQE